MENNVVMGKCPNCKQEFEISNDTKNVACPNCKMLLNKEDSVNFFNMSPATTTQTKHNEQKEDGENEQYLLTRANFELNAKNYSKAKDLYEQVLEQNSSNSDAWFGVVKAQTKRFTDFEADSCEEEFYKALSFAKSEDKEKMLNMYDNYINAKSAFEEKQKEIIYDKISLLKDSRKTNLDLHRSSLENNFFQKSKEENIKTIIASSCLGFAFITVLVFGGITIFGSSLTFFQGLISTIGILALTFAMGYYIFNRFMFLFYSKKIFTALLNQTEQLTELEKIINKDEYSTIEILKKMYNKGFIPGFTLYEKTFVLFQTTALTFINKSKKNKEEVISTDTKVAKNIKKVDKILNKFKDK